MKFEDRSKILEINAMKMEDKSSRYKNIDEKFFLTMRTTYLTKHLRKKINFNCLLFLYRDTNPFEFIYEKIAKFKLTATEASLPAVFKRT